MRRPSSPKSSQKRRMSSKSARTRSSSQLRSGCSGAKRRRYHWPSATRDQAGPPNALGQSFGGWSPPRALAVAEVVAVARVAARAGGERLLEPRVLVGGVVGDEVDDHLEAVRVRVLDQAARVVERAEQRVDPDVVADVVAAVLHRRRVPGRDPDPVDAKLTQVPQPRAQPGKVADPVPVAVREAPDVDLVHDRVAPPRHPLRLGHRASVQLALPCRACPLRPSPARARLPA